MLNLDIALLKDCIIHCSYITYVNPSIGRSTFLENVASPRFRNYRLTHKKMGLLPVDWLGDASNAFWSVLFVDIWQQVSFMISVLLSGLASLPKEVFEAAEIDGVSKGQKFFYITLPMMKPVIFAVITLKIIFAFRAFDLVYILARGGPGIATDVVSYHIYRLTYMSLDMGKATAASYIFLPIILIFIVIAFKLVFHSTLE